MAIPDFQSIFRPMLEIGATKPEWNINDCIDELAVHFDLTEGELEEMQPSGLNSPLKKALLTGFHSTAKHNATKAVSPSSETMRTI